MKLSWFDIFIKYEESGFRGLFKVVASMLLLLRRACDIREQYIPVRVVKQSLWSSAAHTPPAKRSRAKRPWRLEYEPIGEIEEVYDG